ncbi:conserved hypothetical protein [delta proteobacterium NaphS2]|nr:conserved hypothetical protein [delta proteobacterium NaphS2]
MCCLMIDRNSKKNHNGFTVMEIIVVVLHWYLNLTQHPGN